VTFEGHFGDLFTFVILCAQLTRDLLAIAKFLVFFHDWPGDDPRSPVDTPERVDCPTTDVANRRVYTTQCGLVA